MTDTHTHHRIYTSYLPALMLVATLFAATSAYAQVELLASVDKSQVTVGERFTYTITATGGMNVTVSTPDFGSLSIVYGPSQSSSVQIVNGSMSSSRTIEYGLRALSPGKYTIKPVTARYKGNDYISGSVIVDVVPAGSPNTPGSPDEKLPNSVNKLPDVFMRVTAGKDNVYLREMVILTYRLYLCTTVNNYNIVKIPQASGFWQEEFPQSNRPVLEDVTLQGRPYKAAVIRKVALFPTRTGKLTVEPLVADLQVVVQQARRSRSRGFDPFDMFNDPFFNMNQTEQRTVTTDPVTITVNDLPAAGKGTNFNGDVGDYDFHVSYDKREVDQNAAVTMVVTVSGTGYLKSVDALKIKLPSGFEQYAPTVEEHIAPSGNAVSGEKKFTYLIIPRRSGTYTLDPVSFTYFDPASKSYQTKTAGGTELTVNPSTAQYDDQQSFSQSEIHLLDSDIRFVKELDRPLQRIEDPFFSTFGFYAGVFIFPLLFVLGIGGEQLWNRYNADPVTVRRRKAPEKMRQAHSTALRLAKTGELRKAIDTAGLGLSELVGAVIDVPSAALTSEIIRAKLLELNADEALVNEVLDLNGESDRIRFAGVALDNEYTAAVLKRFKSVAEMVEKLR